MIQSVRTFLHTICSNYVAMTRSSES